MELKEFINNVLTEIIDGVIQAQEYAKTKGAVVAPKQILETSVTGSSIGNRTFKSGRNIAHYIDFEAALNQVDSNETSKKIGVALNIFAASGDNKQGGSSSSSTNIKFSIPVIYPAQDDQI